MYSHRWEEEPCSGSNGRRSTRSRRLRPNRELQASIEIDDPNELAVVAYAAQLLETRYAVARITGYSDREPILDYADIVEFFTGLDEVLDALTERRVGVIDLYPGHDSAEFRR